MSANIDPVRLTVAAADGRIVIPADMRRAMRVDASGRVGARELIREHRDEAWRE